MWVYDSFVIDGDRYYYEAKVFDEPSKFGILDGRISKLTIWKCVSKELRSLNNIILQYDRDMVVKPSFEDRAAIDYILNLYK